MFCYDDRKDYDILLLDIEMGDMDGVAMAKKLRKQDDNVQIVFITGYSDYIAEGYEVAALHYLMKPVKKEKLLSVLDRAVEKLSKNEKMINMELGGELVRIPIYQISRVTRALIKLADGTEITLPRGAFDAVNRAIIKL